MGVRRGRRFQYREHSARFRDRYRRYGGRLPRRDRARARLGRFAELRQRPGLVRESGSPVRRSGARGAGDYSQRAVVQEARRRERRSRRAEKADRQRARPLGSLRRSDVPLLSVRREIARETRAATRRNLRLNSWKYPTVRQRPPAGQTDPLHRQRRLRRRYFDQQLRYYADPHALPVHRRAGRVGRLLEGQIRRSLLGLGRRSDLGDRYDVQRARLRRRLSGGRLRAGAGRHAYVRDVGRLHLARIPRVSKGRRQIARRDVPLLCRRARLGYRDQT